MVNPADLSPSPEQAKAWGYYGLPSRSYAMYGRRDGVPRQAVGEVRYVVGWMADQMVRMGWRVVIDGSETWRLALPGDGSVITSDSEEDDPESDRHPANASRVLLSAVGWTDAMVRQVTTNLFVAGELWYISDGKTWASVSMIDPNLAQRVRKATLSVHGLWPHPADPESPDAPLFGVLGVLDDLTWLTRLERSQSASRIGMRGIMLVADTLRVRGSDSDDADAFWAAFDAAMSSDMDSPESAAPVGLRAPADLVESSGSGTRGLQWIIPDFPYDDKVSARIAASIDRLSYGLPVPPEILLGLKASSRATAYQMEGNAYRAHVEPAALTIAQVAEDALTKLLPEVGVLSIVPDPTKILARRHTVQDVFEAFDRGAVGFDYLREAIGIPGRAAVTDEDMALMKAMRWRTATVIEGAPDDQQTVEQGGEDGLATVAAVTLPPGEGDAPAPDAPETGADQWLAARLERIDSQLLAEVIGAAGQAVAKARERLGAYVRSRADLRAEIPSRLSNAEVALQLGADKLDALGVPVGTIISASLASAVDWYGARVREAQGEAAKILASGEVDVAYDSTRTVQSTERFAEALRAGVFAESGAQPGSLRAAIDLAGA